MSQVAALAYLSSLDAVARHAAGALIAGLWEGILLAVALTVGLRVIPQTTATLRFLVWIAAFHVLALLPFLNGLLAFHAPAPAALSTAPHLQLDPRWSYALAAIWVAAVVVRAAHLALQAIKLRSLWNSAIPVKTQGLLPPDFEMWEVNRTAGVHFRHFPKIRKEVQLCTSTDLDRPCVIGFFAPRILIPDWLFEQITPGELRQIVLHELEHLRRRDDWMNLLQKIGLLLFPLNPALLWIDRRLATERELACEDGVLGQTRAPRTYATCLTGIAERRLKHRHRNPVTALALGAVDAVRRSDFSRRIESILGFSGRPSLNSVSARALVTLLLAGVLGGAAVLTSAPQAVSFTPAAMPQPAVTQSVPVIGVKGPLSTARFENAVFHPSQAAAGNSPAAHPAKHTIRRRSVRAALHVDAIRFNVAPNEAEPMQRPDRRWIVLTAWRQSASRSVLVTLPDGRTFFATYAAAPNTNPDQAGWLLLQL